VIVLSDLLSLPHTTRMQDFNIERLDSACISMAVVLAAYPLDSYIYDPTRHPARLSFTPRTGSGVMRDRVARSALIASHNSDAGFQH
jgi:hypothetical protein